MEVAGPKYSVSGRNIPFPDVRCSSFGGSNHLVDFDLITRRNLITRSNLLPCPSHVAAKFPSARVLEATLSPKQPQRSDLTSDLIRPPDSYCCMREDNHEFMSHDPLALRLLKIKTHLKTLIPNSAAFNLETKLEIMIKWVHPGSTPSCARWGRPRRPAT